MRTYECQTCGQQVQGLMNGAAHRCPKGKSKWTVFKQVAGPAPLVLSRKQLDRFKPPAKPVRS